MSTETLKKALGKYCKDYRAHVVRISLKEMEKRIGIKSRTLSNFENGRSGNVAFLSAYLQICGTREDKTRFIIGLTEILDSHDVSVGVVNNG